MVGLVVVPFGDIFYELGLNATIGWQNSVISMETCPPAHTQIAYGTFHPIMSSVVKITRRVFSSYIYAQTPDMLKISNI